jgi:hypothetical protein
MLNEADQTEPDHAATQQVGSRVEMGDGVNG